MDGYIIDDESSKVKVGSVMRLRDDRPSLNCLRLVQDSTKEHQYGDALSRFMTISHLLPSSISGKPMMSKLRYSISRTLNARV